MPRRTRSPMPGLLIACVAAWTTPAVTARAQDPPAEDGGDGGAPAISAEVLALRDAHVPAEVPGRVIQRPDDETIAVEEGDVVVALDDALLAPIARGARAAAERARAQRDLASAEFERVRKLFEKGTIGESEFDRAEFGRREAQAAFEAADAAAVEAEARLARTRIRAPFRGRLVRVPPEQGEYLQIGQTAFRIVDDSSLRIVAYLDARQLRDLALEVGTRVEGRAHFEGPSAPPLDATICSVAPAAEGPARTFRVEARMERQGDRLRPGMAASLRIRARLEGRAPEAAPRRPDTER